MTKREYFPALRGRLGDWAFYSILMTLDQIAQRVNYAKEIHNSENLSKLIQRELDDKKRASEIGNYLLNNKDRFFNSLVVAVYGGDPEWHEFQNLRPVSADLDVGELSYSSRYSIGFLSLLGTEKLFALDGQHRLAGIRNALKQAEGVGEDEVSVIIVAHHTDSVGLQRTRKLFTTLNKTAKPVSKSEIIALDEADAMAITARHLVENDSRFGDKLIDIMRKQANLPKSDMIHLMTLINLYDILEILFVKSKKGTKNDDLKRVRPTDDKLDEYAEFAKKYFTLLGKAFPALKTCFGADDPSSVIVKHRRSDGGSVLFRPVGLLIFTEIAASLIREHDMTLEQSIAALKKLPTELSKFPYEGTLWNAQAGTMDIKHKALVRDILRHTLGYIKEAQLKKLKARYETVRGDGSKFLDG